MKQMYHRMGSVSRALLIGVALTLVLSAASAWQLAASAKTTWCSSHQCGANNLCAQIGCDGCGAKNCMIEAPNH